MMDNSEEYNDGPKEEDLIWEKMYMHTEEWQHDLAFFKDEFWFLHNLIGGYVVWVGNEDDMAQIQTIVKRLNKLQDVRGELNQKLTKQMVALEELLNKSHKEPQWQVKEENIVLSKLLKDFTKDIRALKKDIHTITKIVTDSKKFKQLKKS
jgi:hypothetical protein